MNVEQARELVEVATSAGPQELSQALDLQAFCLCDALRETVLAQAKVDKDAAKCTLDAVIEYVAETLSSCLREA
jgi:hypothetical protein